MKHLLHIEWLKIKRYRTFWVLIGMFVILMPVWNYGIVDGFLKLGGNGKNSINFLNTAYSFPQVWGNLGFWGSIFISFISVLVIILVTNEYTYRTNRQNVIDGWTRMQFYHANVLLVFVLSFCATLFMLLLGLVFGGVSAGSLSNFFSGFEQVGYFFILCVDYLGFALFLAIWIRRSGLAIGLFFLYSMILENILKGLINHYADMPYGNLLMLQSSDELLPFPLMRMATAMLGGGPAISVHTYAFIAVCWCIIYYFAGRLLLLKKDW